MRYTSTFWSLCCLLAYIVVGIMIIQSFQIQLQHMSENDNTETTVPVPISEIMSGKPVVLPQDDKRIIDYIWHKGLLLPPSEQPYDLKDPTSDPSMGQSTIIQKILKNMTNGFFIECGALDGETRSNSLFMEKNLDWKGLLVEADPSNFKLVQKKNRKAWVSNTCLAIKPYPHTATFRQNFNIGKIISTEEDAPTNKPHYTTVQCVPLFSLLTALNVTTIDYFSLDVEGSELQVLKTIPFDKVYIRTLSVEFAHTVEGKNDLRKFMKNLGYKMVKELHHVHHQANDFIFVHKDI